MIIYNSVRAVPDGAKKKIAGGRLKGKTDINPMWRIQTLTELFGPCGIGWKYEIVKMWTEQGASGEIAAFAQINLYFRHEGEWSEPIPGVGGSGFIKTESGALTTNDESYKMALTDAISVSCKALGIGADVYWEEGSKYTRQTDAPESKKYYCDVCGAEILPAKLKDGSILSSEEQATRSIDRYGRVLCIEHAKAAKAESVA